MIILSLSNMWRTTLGERTHVGVKHSLKVKSVGSQKLHNPTEGDNKVALFSTIANVEPGNVHIQFLASRSGIASIVSHARTWDKHMFSCVFLSSLTSMMNLILAILAAEA
jgi:hypothetical protein